MNPEPTLALWLRTFVVLGAGVAVAVVLAALAAWPIRTGTGRRAVWQATTLGLAVVLLAELTATPAVVRAWLAEPRTSGPESVETARALDAKPPPATEPFEAPGGEELAPVDASRPLLGEGPTWWPGLLWLGGAALVAGRTILARALLFLFRLRQRVVTDAELQERCRAVAGRLGLRRPVRLLEAAGLTGPVAFGFAWPTVALPVGFASDFTPVQQEAMLAHELGHLAAGDPIWHLLSDLVTAVLWWHPLAWEARLRLRAASETAADDASVVVAEGPAVLADCLVQMGRRLTGARAGAWERMAGGGLRSSLGWRVQRLLSLDANRPRAPGRVRLGLILVLGPAFLFAGALGTTAWLLSGFLSEGEAMSTTQFSWKRSLGAMAVMAVLASSPDTPASPPDTPTPPAVPGGGKPVEKKEEVKDRAAALKVAEDNDVATAAELKALAERLASLRALRQKLADVEARPGLQSDKIEKEIRDLETKVKRLEDERKELQAKVESLREEVKQERVAPRIKVFRLSHRDPNEVRDVLQRLLPPSGDGGKGPPGAGMPGMGPGVGPMGGGGRGFPRMGGAPMGGGMPGMGGFPSWRLAVDQRTNSLIVRGSERDLQNAADFVAMLDVADGKPMPQMKNVRAFKLKVAVPEEVAAILEALDLGVQVAPVGKGKMVVVSGPEATLKDVAEVITAVDQEGKPANRPPEKK